MGLGIIGAGIGAAGTLAGGLMQSNMYGYQAQVAAANAANIRQYTAYNEQARETALAEQGKQAGAGIGKFVAGTGAAGVETRTGSAAQVAANMRAASIRNAQTLSSQYAQKSQQMEWAQFGQLAQQNIDQYAADTLPWVSGLTALGQFASGAAKFV